MRRLNWNEEDWLSKSHTHLKKEIKDIPKIKSNSNLLKIKKPTIRSNTEDRTERKNKVSNTIFINKRWLMNMLKDYMKLMKSIFRKSNIIKRQKK